MFCPYREVYSKRTFEIRTRLKLDKGTKAWKVWFTGEHLDTDASSLISKFSSASDSTSSVASGSCSHCPVRLLERQRLIKKFGWVVLILLNMNRNCIDGEESQNWESDNIFASSSIHFRSVFIKIKTSQPTFFTNLWRSSRRIGQCLKFALWNFWEWLYFFCPPLNQSKIGKWKAEKHYPESVVIIQSALYIITTLFG